MGMLESGTDAGPRPVEAGRTSSDAGRTTGCGQTGAKTGTFTINLTVAGVARTAQVIVPANYNASTPVPLVFVFHGLGGTSAGAESFGLQGAASTAGTPAVFAFPQGVAQSGGVGWDLSCGGHDVALFDAIRAQLEGQYCIQTNRVFATGFSWGADFTNSLGCCRGTVLRAIAPASGALYTSGCETVAPAFRLTSGTADAFYAQSDFQNGVTHFEAANHCSTASAPVAPAPCKAWAGCTQPVIWCSYAGMPHALPPMWANDTWAFFETFP